MILSRPYEDDDEMQESMDEYASWARKRFSIGANDAEDDRYDDA